MKAEELIKNKLYITQDGEPFDVHDSINNVKEVMIEFAKYHVELALKTASEKAEVFLAKDWIRKTETLHPTSLVDSIKIKVYTPSILNSYLLENIK